jgi:2-iminobutanoate/2-iminopropanoate deaminase
MIEKIDVGMAPSDAPVSDCIRAGQHLWLVAISEDPASGEIVGGDIAIQTRQTLDNLERALKAAGGSLRDVVQVQVFLTDKADAAGMNAVYREYFTQPYPVRATVIAGLLAAGLKVEMLATAVIG